MNRRIKYVREFERDNTRDLATTVGRNPTLTKDVTLYFTYLINT